MVGLTEISTAIMAQSARSLEYSAQNISNLATAGYKRKLPFAEHLQGVTPLVLPQLTARTDWANGKVQETGRAGDLALLSEGFFVARTREGDLALLRGGSFTIDEDGRWTATNGAVLQDASLKDLRAPEAGEVTSDGLVLVDGTPVAQIAVAAPLERELLTAGDGFFRLAAGADLELMRPVLQQGALEASNVSPADEMVAMMDAIRRAETGQRVVQVYDELMGRALSTFGQG